MTPAALFIGYKQWQEVAIRAAEKTNPLVTCPSCNGGGYTECDCCGAERDCDVCESSGEVWFADVPNIDRAKCFTLSAYKDNLLEDVKALAAWLTLDMFVLLVELGYHPYVDTRSKRLWF